MSVSLSRLRAPRVRVAPSLRCISDATGDLPRHPRRLRIGRWKGSSLLHNRQLAANGWNAHWPGSAVADLQYVQPLVADACPPPHPWALRMGLDVCKQSNGIGSSP